MMIDDDDDDDYELFLSLKVVKYEIVAGALLSGRRTLVLYTLPYFCHRLDWTLLFAL